jgi:hypothetical protein
VRVGTCVGAFLVEKSPLISRNALSLFSSALQQEKDRGGEKCISFRTMVGTVFGEKRSCPDKVII